MFVIQRNPFKLSATSKSSLLGSRAFCQQLLCPCCLLLARDLLSDGAFQAEHLRLALATIPAHADNNLSTFEEANEIGAFFSKISAEFEPLDISKLPERVKEKMHDIEESINNFHQGIEKRIDEAVEKVKDYDDLIFGNLLFLIQFFSLEIRQNR